MLKGMPLEQKVTWVRRAHAQMREVGPLGEVNSYLGVLPLLWLAVDPPEDGPQDRAYLERNTIALESNFHGDEPLDAPTGGWLGRHSSRAEVRGSGLWNVNHVAEEYEPEFLGSLEAYLAQV